MKKDYGMQTSLLVDVNIAKLRQIRKREIGVSFFDFGRRTSGLFY